MHSTEQLASAIGGRYAIERTLGVGGMATVYLAENWFSELRRLAGASK